MNEHSKTAHTNEQVTALFTVYAEEYQKEFPGSHMSAVWAVAKYAVEHAQELGLLPAISAEVLSTDQEMHFWRQQVQEQLARLDFSLGGLRQRIDQMAAMSLVLEDRGKIATLDERVAALEVKLFNRVTQLELEEAQLREQVAALRHEFYPGWPLTPPTFGGSR